MCAEISQFDATGYRHLQGFLDLESCEQLTEQLRKLAAEGATEKDEQCPLSEAVYRAPVFDSMLEQLLPNFEYASGKRLFPTYSYARLYAPGDELKIHRDRSACEISATLTLGFEGTPWPIYMGDSDSNGDEYTDQSGAKIRLGNIHKIQMEVGDAVLYRGMEKYHWRDKFEGKWQAQVFLHYVDADGPHADWKYDKRGKLAHHITPDYRSWHYSDILTPDACKKLIESLEAQVDGEEAQIGMGADGIVDKDIRDVKRVSLPTYRGIGATMVGIGMDANQQVWKFDVTGSNQTDYLKYDKHGHYKAHVDTFMNPGDPQTRKLTVLLFLNDDFEGGRLFLQDGNEKVYPPQNAGTALVFPSYMLHGVEPVTSGIRRSIVTWLIGPWFK